MPYLTTILFWLVPICFTGFYCLDIISIMPRIAGSITGKNGIGYSFQNIINTLKRVFAVIYPPILGYLGSVGGIHLLLLSIFASFTSALIFLFIVSFFKQIIITSLCAATDEYSNSGKLLNSFLYGIKKRSDWVEPYRITVLLSGDGRSQKTTNQAIFISALWVYFIYSASPFFINIMGAQYQQYATVILQLNGLASALGTIVLAFFLDPKLAHTFEQAKNLESILKSLLQAHLFNLLIMSPLFFGIFWYFV